jgi:hypothetical protein
MTKLLEKAFKRASKLSDLEQNTFAKWVLGELGSEKKWEVMFAVSEYMLDKLADKALDEHKQGKAKTLNIAKL